jgi:hypothetical protein
MIALQLNFGNFHYPSSPIEQEHAALIPAASSHTRQRMCNTTHAHSHVHIFEHSALDVFSNKVIPLSTLPAPHSRQSGHSEVAAAVIMHHVQPAIAVLHIVSQALSPRPDAFKRGGWIVGWRAPHLGTVFRVLADQHDFPVFCAADVDVPGQSVTKTYCGKVVDAYTEVSGSWINSTADVREEPTRCLITLQGRSRWS